MVQVTEFADGVFVALSMNHSVVDGTTFWDFFNVWSELARGDSAAVSRRDAFVFGQECFTSPAHVPFRYVEPLEAVPSPLLEQRLFRFTRAKIAELKARANAESPGAGREISSLQALTGHLWVCITRSRALPDNEIVYFMTPVCMRSRLRPPLPRSYAGNAIVTLAVVCTAGELLGRGTGWAARQVNEAIAERSGMGTREFFGECAEKFASPPDLAIYFAMQKVAVGGSPRFDAYGNDFGWGRPVVQRSGDGNSAAYNGLLNAFPGPEEGSVDFEVTLVPEVFHALARDPEFTQYVHGSLC